MKKKRIGRHARLYLLLICSQVLVPMQAHKLLTHAVLLSCALQSTFSRAHTTQPPASYLKVFGEGGGSSFSEFGYDIAMTDDGNFWGVGYSESYGNGREVLVFSYDPFANLSWAEILLGPSLTRDDEYGQSLVATRDNGTVLAGYSSGFLEGNDYNVFAIKLTQKGLFEWGVVFGQEQQDYGYTIVHTLDGGYVIAGATKSYSAPNNRYDVLLAKLNSTGGPEWLYTIRGDHHDYAQDLYVTRNGTILLVGTTRSYGNGFYSILLANFDENGQFLWSKILIGSDSAEGNGIVETSDGGIAMVGVISDPSYTDKDIIIVKIHANHTVAWIKRIGDTRLDTGSKIVATDDGGVVAVGTYYHTGSYGLSAIIIRLNASGDLVWARLLAGASADYLLNILTDEKGDFIVTGHSRSYGAGEDDVLFGKVNAGGDCWIDITPPFSDITSEMTLQDINPEVQAHNFTVEPLNLTISRKTPQQTTVCLHTASPTESPIPAPTPLPTPATLSPSQAPTTSPTASPTQTPTSPTTSPSATPTEQPTPLTSPPSESPTPSPTYFPTNSPTLAPSQSPTLPPTQPPTPLPTSSPTLAPSQPPTVNPTPAPSSLPTERSTPSPTQQPISAPPSLHPVMPSRQPTKRPTTKPPVSARSPTKKPLTGNAADTSSKETTQPFLSTPAGITVIVLLATAVAVGIVIALYFFCKKGASTASSAATNTSASIEIQEEKRNRNYMTIYQSEA